MEKKLLYTFNTQGLIPGPDETEEEFLLRVDECQNLKKEIEVKLETELPFSADQQEDRQNLEEAYQIAKSLYDIKPEWIPIFYSNHQLTLWHGGCAWIIQMNEESPRTALLQLRKAFRSSPTYLKIYHRDELVAHELAHVGRMAFEEPKFEEFFAFRSSKSAFRRWLGPIVQAPWESMLFLISLFLIFLFDIFLVTTGQYEIYQAAMWMKIAPIGLVALALGRLWHRHRQLNRCCKQLNIILKDKSKADAAAYRLADDEIIAFGHMSPNEIVEFAEREKENSLRWLLIHSAYFA